MQPSRRSLELVSALVELLPKGGPSIFNPYRDTCGHDLSHNTPEAKRARLASHLDCDARYILVGEAPGYQGCRYSGIAFTSERLLIEGSVPRVPREPGRLTGRKLPFSEPSATIVWKALYRLGIAEKTVMWNALQLHPVGGRGVWSNRTPSPAELASGMPALHHLRAAFPSAEVIAVGRKSQESLQALGLNVRHVRHPANGGATEFAEGLAAIVAEG